MGRGRGRGRVRVRVRVRVRARVRARVRVRRAGEVMLQRACASLVAPCGDLARKVDEGGALQWVGGRG